MFHGLLFEPVDLPDGEKKLRAEVRDFLKQAIPSDYLRNSNFGASESHEFSRKLGDKGWIGITWPRQYGGHERSFLERYIVTEELLAAGAPVGSHWIADRQSGPQLLRFGTPQQCEKYLPGIAAGESYFSIGMSEPDTGSDLASITTRAEKVDGGWIVNGTKIWTSGAHSNHYMIALVRTAPKSDNRHAGMSQLIINLKDSKVKVSAIRDLSGHHGFNEVVFENLFVPDEDVIGDPGNGWEQVISELGYERSGPERFLSSFRVFVEFVRVIGEQPDGREAQLVGRLAAHLMTLRQMSISVAGMLEAGKSPNVEAALVKDLGNTFEREVPEMVRLALNRERLYPGRSPTMARDIYMQTLNQCILEAPSYTLRGGTREILRGVIARGLGLR
jgi:alkylation response protein AidB-like acyl-CoA dehydrogenase